MCARAFVLPWYGEGGAVGKRLGLNSNFCDKVELLSVSMPSTNLWKAGGVLVWRGAEEGTLMSRGMKVWVFLVFFKWLKTALSAASFNTTSVEKTALNCIHTTSPTRKPVHLHSQQGPMWPTSFIHGSQKLQPHELLRRLWASVLCVCCYLGLSSGGALLKLTTGNCRVVVQECSEGVR